MRWEGVRCVGVCLSLYVLTMYTASEMRLGQFVHCECAVLAHLDMFFREHPTLEAGLIPYIGTSKRPCALCDVYIEVFNEVTIRNIRAAHTQGKLVAWRRPILQSDQEETVRAVLHGRFVDRLWDRVQLQLSKSVTSESGLVTRDGNS